MGIVIDNEFRSLIPPLTDDEYDGLRDSILSEGCRDALVLWGDTLIDGHNRYEICEKHGIPYDTIEIEFRNRDEAKLWIYKNQMSRRNLNDFQRVEITHKVEDAVKAKARERQYEGKNQYSERVQEKFPEGSQSRDELGAMAGVSGKTYEHAIEVLENAPAPIVDAVRNGELSINAGYQVTKLEPEQQEEIAMMIEQGEDPREAVKRPHVAFNSGNNEWYTPAEFIELARDVMGSIDIDPASSEIANQIVKAEEYYTVETNGLDKKWHGNVWMNPPYASDLIGKFVDKLIAERGNYRQATVLVNNATETEWFNKIISISSAVCFPKSRVKFYMPDGKTGAPLQGQAVLYIGENAHGFINSFSSLGWVAVVHGLFGE